jgi:two-component system chemotaxis response regulator CheY
MRAVVKGVLEGEGHEVIIAEDGKEALNYANEQSVDLVITDLPMPNMNGTRLVHQLRLLDHYKATPILMLTTEGAEEQKKKARNLGASG